MAEKKSGNTAAKVYSIADPIAEKLGLSIWDIRYVKEGTEWYLRVFIDKAEGGVDIDDCVNMSHALDKPLDDGDFIPHSYTLEVSSPGVERELTREAHFTAMLGRKIKMKLIRPFEGQREFCGVLEDYDGGNIILSYDNNQKICVNKKETAWIRLDDFGGND